jgi:chromosomal replication initiation ATPase DnaA
VKSSAYVRRCLRSAGLTWAELHSEKQGRALSAFRQDLALELRERLCLRLTDIARLIGRRTHADAVYAIRAARKRKGLPLRGAGVGVRPR